ncbi:Berberine bridge enzyme-like 25 [Linum grandiflorum]
MAASPFLLLLLLLPLSSCLALAAAEQQPRYHFLQCLNSESSASISHLVYTQTNPSYSSVLQFSIRNPRFNTTSTAKPVLVITPKSISHIQATIECSRKHNLQLRIRSGGHDYEGLSYASTNPNAQFDVASKTAWVQAGATLGELYYAISQKSTRFPRNTPPEILLNRTITLLTGTAKYKGKSDYVQRPISEIGWEGVWKKLDELGPMAGALAMIPYGGKMEEIPEWSLPFPHRAGNLFMIQYDVFWNEDGIEASERNVNWIREVYSYMTPFVSKNPRAAYMNYRDLDIGMNDIDGGKGRGYEEEEARVWGLKYFKNNWDRLVEVKTAVDPDDFFRNEQSIPPLAQ